MALLESLGNYSPKNSYLPLKYYLMVDALFVIEVVCLMSATFIVNGAIGVVGKLIAKEFLSAIEILLDG